GITSICKRASDERRGYTQEEITQLDEYFAKLRELKDREIAIQNSIAEAITQQAVTNAQAFQGTLEEYKIQSQEWIKTATEQKNATVQLIEQGTIEEVALLNQRYATEEERQSEAYQKEYAKIMEQKQKKIDIALEEVQKVNEVYASGYAERSKGEDSFYNTLKEYANKQETLLNNHNEQIRKIKDGELWYVTNTAQAINSENETYAFHQKEIWKEMYKNMTDEQAKELGTWIAMLSQTELYGGDISEENKKMVDTILDSYEGMPAKTQDAMKNAMSPMLTEMENKEPSLFEKASGIANGILSRLKKAFDIHSPSKKTKSIFKNVMQGAELGFEDEEKNIYKKTDNIAKRILNGFDISSLYEKMQSKINLETQKLSANLTTGAIINVQRNANVQARLESIDNNKEIQVNSTLNLDGKVVANTVNRVNARQKLQYGIA
ncbi:MAG: hypothetical protein IJ272_05535, partial [Clostridia bacterium]|nr:hypothetical protein [Clostridia bacterium]